MFNNKTIINSHRNLDLLIKDRNYRNSSYYESFNKIIDKFDAQIYLPLLKDLIDKCKSRGMAIKFRDMELLSYCIAGRIMFTIRDLKSKHWISMVAAEKCIPSRMGLHGLHGSPYSLKCLYFKLLQAVKLADLEKQFVRSDDVFFG